MMTVWIMAVITFAALAAMLKGVEGIIREIYKGKVALFRANRELPTLPPPFDDQGGQERDNE